MTTELKGATLNGYLADVSLRDDGHIFIEIPFPKGREAEYLFQRLTGEKPKKKGYCQRTRELIQDIRDKVDDLAGEELDWNTYKIIDYPLEETVAVKYGLGPTPENTHTHFTREQLLKHNAEIRLVKYVKDGTIICYHFND